MVRNTHFDGIRDLIDHMADARPHETYLLDPESGAILTYRELQNQSRALCAGFRALGLANGDKIAFLMDNGLFTAQFFLATMYGGFVSVPLNVRGGVAQLSAVVRHSDTRVVLAARKYEALIQEILGGVEDVIDVIFDDTASELQTVGSAAHDLLGRPNANDPAMLIYTSGSTGVPKGALHTHKSVLAHGRNSLLSHELTAADRSLLVLPLYHINAECVTLVPTLMSGGSVVVPRGFAAGQFWEWIGAYRCTWSALVPTIISQLLDSKRSNEAVDPQQTEHIRFFRSSSAPLSPSLHREFIEQFKVPLIQAMGSSEAGNVFSNPVPPGRNKIGSPGLPWGFEAKIVDAKGFEVPAGEPGEVLLRGDGMASEYYKDPAGTRAAFDVEGWLHTGDLAYRDADGYFFVVGRSKELIIKGGMNIAPKQIDEVLEAHPAVLEAASVGVPDRYFGEDIAAFVILRSGAHCNEGELLSFCEGQLGYFKTPTRIGFVQDLPKGPSGKIQRLHLVDEAARLLSDTSEAGADIPALASGDVDVSTDQPLEQIIAGIWADILSQQAFPADSNFFALGGQSLQAIQCLSRLRQKTSILLSLSEFFENATVADLAALLRRKLANSSKRANANDDADLASHPIPTRDRSAPCPLSPSQERIWFMEQFDTGEPAYNEAEAVRVKGNLNVKALQSAFAGIIARHEILRTTIASNEQRPSMVVHETWPMLFKTIDLTHLGQSEREKELERLVTDEPRRPYRLEEEPGIRVTVVELEKDDHAVILMMHHIICDSSSLGILWRELGALYVSALLGQPNSLPSLPIQYGDYAVWQHDAAQQARFNEDISFWKEKLRNAPCLLDQPTDRPRPPFASFRGNKRLFEIDEGVTADLRRFCREQRVSLFTAFAAALNTVMHRYTGQDDILVGIPIADRERPELRPLIGFLLDTHVLRTDLRGNPKFSELMARVQRGVADVYSHRAPPFDQVVAAVQPVRNMSYSPFFQVMLNWRDRDDQPQFIGLPGVRTQPLLAHSRISKFDLTLVLTDDGTKICIEAEYNTDLFDESRVERLIGHLRTLVAGAAANTEQRLSELPLLTQSELQQLLNGWETVDPDEVYS